MFNKLRNKLIWINVGITSAVLLVVFSAIYIIYTQSADRRPPVPVGNMTIYADDVENIIEISIKNEKQVAARELLTMLIISGLVIEVAVALVSYFLAEQAIKPVKEAYNSQKVFIANASHEIKTPLAAIAANLEAADVKGNRFIDNVERETEKLARLNGELLALARTDLVNDVSLEDVELKQAISQEIVSCEPRMKDIKFTKSINVSGKRKIAKADFLQIFNILMDNAIKYSDKKICLSLNDHELVIANDGATISREDLPHIFERFYQTDKSAEGVGLGLAIAKSLAERNNWVLSAESTKNQTEFILKY